MDELVFGVFLSTWAMEVPRIFLGIWYIRSYLILVAIWIYIPLGTAFGYRSELSNQRMDALCGIDHMVFTFGSNRSEGFPIVFCPQVQTSFWCMGLNNDSPNMIQTTTYQEWSMIT